MRRIILRALAGRTRLVCALDAGRRDCFREWLLPGVGTIGQDVPQIPVLLPVEFVEDDRVGVRPILAAGIG